MFNQYGQPTQVTQSSVNEWPRVVTTTYSPSDSYFPETATNDVGTTTTYTNPAYGQPDTIIDMNGLQTHHEYDPFGKNSR